MKTGLDCVAVHELPWVVLDVVGELNLSSGPRLRAAVLKALADQPSAVIINAEGLTAADDIHLTVFIAVARHAAAWPSIPILVCAPRPELGASLVRLGIDRHVTICADLDEGRDRAARHELPAMIRDEFPPVPASVTAARDLIGDACQRWRLGRFAALAGLVVTELVSNAVRHAGTRIDLAVSHTDRHLHLSVRDYTCRPARLVGPAGEDQPGGRGLLIVEAVAASWGCTPTRDGKVTWASVSTR